MFFLRRLWIMKGRKLKKSDFSPSGQNLSIEQFKKAEKRMNYVFFEEKYLLLDHKTKRADPKTKIIDGERFLYGGSFNQNPGKNYTNQIPKNKKYRIQKGKVNGRSVFRTWISKH